MRLNASPAFLLILGMSLFDALGPSPPSDQDLDALAGWLLTSRL